MRGLSKVLSRPYLRWLWSKEVDARHLHGLSENQPNASHCALPVTPCSPSRGLSPPHRSPESRRSHSQVERSRRESSGRGTPRHGFTPSVESVEHDESLEVEVDIEHTAVADDPRKWSSMRKVGLLQFAYEWTRNGEPIELSERYPIFFQIVHDSSNRLRRFDACWVWIQHIQPYVV